MAEYNLNIEKIVNGYLVRCDDPKIRKANQGKGPWRDPSRKYTFKTKKEVCTFIEENIDKALPEDDFDSTFATAAAAKD